MSPLAVSMLCLVAALALGGGLIAGYASPDAPPEPVVAVARHAPAADLGPLRAPGADDVAALDGLAADLAVAPVAAPTARIARPPATASIPAPVRHDVGPIFRAETSAIIRLGDRRLAVVLAPYAGQGRSRILKVGDLFDDRWRLTALSLDEAVLGDGQTTERVPLFAHAPAPGQSAGPVE